MKLKYNYIYQIAIKVIVDLYYKIKMVVKPVAKNIYVYTDSRGFYVNKWYCKKNPIYSYIQTLAHRYKVDYKLCNYKHTTLLDFICDYEEEIRHKKHDVIVIHLGVVDFSPRTKNQAEEVLALKKLKLQKAFGTDSTQSLTIHEYSELYDGNVTASLYSKDFLKYFIIDKINKIESKVIWIGVNRVLTDWNGNYDKTRPSNINVINEYQGIVDDNFRGELISLSDWSDEEIKKYTVDNIHLSIDGFNYISRLIENKVST